jgi:glycoprotein 2-beta-D-xylosyltransferase
MKEQLKFIRKTDILIGMHGAGLTHALFLPKTSGLIELFPQNFRKTFHFYKLFEVIAQRRDLHYSYWENTDDENEMPNYFTRVDPVSFLSVVDNMIKKVCADNKQYNQ